MHAALLLLLAIPGQEPVPVPKAPEPGYIFPPGGKTGTTVSVQIGVFDATPDMQFFFADPRLKLELLGPPGPILVQPAPYWFGPKSTVLSMPMAREMPARLTLPADMPPGPVRWQVANANGGSTTAGTFWVGTSAEYIEDQKAKGPQRVPSLPVTVNGRLWKIEEIDRYRFRAPRSGPITCELFARRLGANFHGVVEVRDAKNHLIADVADTEGMDLALTFAAQEGEEYTLSLHDVDFHGDRSFGYRLEITAAPRVVAALPTTGRRGQTRPVEFVGFGIATGQPRLESVTRQVAFPAGDADSFLYRLQTDQGSAPAFRLHVSDRDETVAPPAPAAAPRPLVLPAAITGCLDSPGAVHHYRCHGKKGDTWSLALEARRFGAPLDVALAVVGPDGKELARSDDLPGTTDAGLLFTVPVDGEYTVAVTDVAGKSGTRAAVYRLTAERARRDFTLTVAPRMSVPIGGKADLQVSVQWHSPFREMIGLRLVGLPPGIIAPAFVAIPAGAASVNVALVCGADAAATASRVQVIGTAKHCGQSHLARPSVPGRLALWDQDDARLDTVLIAATMKPRCLVTTVVADGTVKVNRGATYPAELIVKRLEGFAGEISLQMSAQQSYQNQGINGPDFTVAPGATRAFYPCFMPEWLETTRTSRMVLSAVVKVPDPRGNMRYLVTPVAGQITMSIEGHLLKVSVPVSELAVRPGQELLLPVKVARAARLAGPVTLELVLPDELQGLLRMEPVVVPPGRADATLRIATSADPRLTGDLTFTIRATALQHGNLRVMSEAAVPFVVVGR